MAMCGLQPGKVYLIQSAFDGTVLDVSGSATKPGTPIFTWEHHRSKNQQWTMKIEGNGFRLESKLSSSIIVADADMKKSALCLWGFTGGPNQQFYIELCDNGNFLFRIRVNDYAIRNMGRGKQVKLVLADKNDISQQWKCHPVEFDD